VEMDCQEAICMITSQIEDRSSCTFMVQEIKRLLKLDPRFQVVAIDRHQNKASHLLANWGRSTASTATWIRDGPQVVLACCLQEAAPVA
jgi:hypothetical protein